ncbi:MAG TPA: hypothetical protein VF533_20350 [Solirubrobacteraceae bacterium]|jgi:hypothetical protein
MAVPPPSTEEERAEAAAVAAATRAARAAIRRRARRAVRAQQRVFRSIRSCDRLFEAAESVERRAVVADALFILATDRATFRARRKVLRAYATRLERLRLRDPVLRAGAEAWIGTVRHPPKWPKGSICRNLRRWRAHGYAKDARPVAPDATTHTFEQLITTNPALAAARSRLRILAAGREVALLFGGELLFAGAGDDAGGG